MEISSSATLVAHDRPQYRRGDHAQDQGVPLIVCRVGINEVMASQDGGSIRSSWCSCDGPGDDAMVYYANLTGPGHGFACPRCRGITQVG